jgi:ferric enterobactin receptor
MKRRLVMMLMGTFLVAAQALAQQTPVTGKVTDEQGTPLPSVSVIIKGTTLGTATNDAGD